MKKLYKNTTRKVFGKKSSRDDVVSRVKSFEFKMQVPGISNNLDTGTSVSASVKRLFKSISGKKDKENNYTSVKKKILRVVALCVLLVIGGGVAHLTGVDQQAKIALEAVDYFHLKDLNIVGCKVTDRSEIKKVAGVDFSTSLLTLDEEVVREKIQAAPWIKSAEVDVSWPATLTITITEYKPEALITLGEETELSLFYLAKTGLPFAPVGPGEELDYPVITGLFSADQITDNEDLTTDIFTFLKQVRRNNPKLPLQAISEIHVNEKSELVVYLVEYPFPIYMGSGEMKKKYRQLLDVLGVLYKKHRKGSKIAQVESIRMDYYDGKVLVSLID